MKNENAKRKAIKKYFEGTSKPLAWLLIVFGVLTLFLIIGILFIFVGLFLLLRKSKSEKDETIDGWIDADFERLDFIGRAKKLAGFESLVRDPIVLRGFSSTEGKDLHSGERLGDDGVLRRTPLAGSVVLCTDSQIGIYQADVDLTTGNLTNEHFVEAFYQDVTGIGTELETQTLNLEAELKGLLTSSMSKEGRKKGFSIKKLRANLKALQSQFSDHIVDGVLQRNVVKIYRIDLIDGDKIRLRLRDGRPAGAMDDPKYQGVAEDSERDMQALRLFVREKKRMLIKSEGKSGEALL